MSKAAPPPVEKRIAVERERRASFFALLKTIHMQSFMAFPRIFGMSTLEQRITMDCLDEMTGRYADFACLLTFSICCGLRNRAATNIFYRYRLPVYLSLVGYDCGLRSGAVCPATTFWNTVPHLDSNLGTVARTVYTPDVFYDVPRSTSFSTSASASSDAPHRLSYVNWATHSALFVVQSLLLQRVLAETFKETCWRRRVDDQTTMTALVMSSRFFRWRLCDIRSTTEGDLVHYRAEIGLHPILSASLPLRWAYRCRRLVLTNSSFPARLWYSAHFAVISALGLDTEVA